MGFMSSFDISGYGLSAQRIRVDTISSNIANASTTRTDEGGPYRRQSVIFKATDFDKVYNEKLGKNVDFVKYENPLGAIEGSTPFAKPPLTSVIIDKIVRDDAKPKMKFEPGHPDANKDGYVAYPNINPVVEMADLIEATRAYQANVSAFQSAKGLATSAIDLMR